MSDVKVPETGAEKIQRVGDSLVNVIKGYTPVGDGRSGAVMLVEEAVQKAVLAIEASDENAAYEAAKAAEEEAAKADSDDAEPPADPDAIVSE